MSLGELGTDPTIIGRGTLITDEPLSFTASILYWIVVPNGKRAESDMSSVKLVVAGGT